MAQVITATATLGLEVTFQSQTRTFTTDLSLNVYRRHESVIYRSKNTIDAANSAFFASKALISTNALHISDRSSSLVANRIEKLDKPVNVENLDHYEVPTDKFIITDVYAASDNSNQSAPLFYQHIISRENLPRISSLDNPTISTDYKLVSVEVVDQNFVPLQLDNIKIDYDKGLVYNNLVSSFDQEVGTAVVYFIRYSIKNSSNLITSYVELLNNEVIFVLADFDDLDGTLNIINDGRKVYLVNEQENSLVVSLPHIGNYSLQLLEDAKIKILPPPQSDVNDVWNVLITNGKFFTTIDSTTYKYSIAEFLNQAWDPAIPYKLASAEDSEFISANLIKVRRQNVLHNPTVSGFVDVLIYDNDTNGVAAFTTDTRKEGVVSSNSRVWECWKPTSKVGIRSVDGTTGILDIDGLELRSDYIFVSTYNYKETNYEFTSVDFNPIHNPDILTRFISIFIDPDSNGTVKQKTLYFTVTDKAGKVVSSNLSNFDNTAEKILLDDGLWHDVYYESIPSYITASGGSILFLDELTVIGSGAMLPLGDIFITEDTHPDQATSIDVRVRGGGIKESEIGNAKALQQETEWYWDLGFWDGTPYPGTASYFVEVPATVLEVAGGTLKDGEVRGVVDRHTAAGVYAIVKAYGIDPIVSGVIPSDGSVVIKWSSYT